MFQTGFGVSLCGSINNFWRPMLKSTFNRKLTVNEISSINDSTKLNVDGNHDIISDLRINDFRSNMAFWTCLVCYLVWLVCVFYQ